MSLINGRVRSGSKQERKSKQNTKNPHSIIPSIEELLLCGGLVTAGRAAAAGGGYTRPNEMEFERTDFGNLGADKSALWFLAVAAPADPHEPRRERIN